MRFNKRMFGVLRVSLAIVAILQLHCFSTIKANGINVNPTSTRRVTVKDIHPRAAPIPPPPSPPTQSPSAEEPRGPLIAMAGQCSFGANSSLAGRTPTFAETGRLYIDIGRPASCTGEVTRWEVCYMVQGLGSSNILIAVLRYDTRVRGYKIQTVHVLEIEEVGQSETSESTCVYMDASEPLFVQQGDLIGFVCVDSVRIALAALPTGISGTLKVYNISIHTGGDGQQQQLRTQRQENLLGVGSVGTDQLLTFNQNVTPLLRIVMNETENNVTSTLPVPTPSMTPTPCSPDEDDSNNTTLFTTLLTASAIIIIILVILVCVLSYCLFKRKQSSTKKCCKWLFCFTSCCCERRGTVTHRITVEPITDQSMMYNELYAPQDQSQIITQGRKVNTEICNNPAYAAADPTAQTGDASNPGTYPFHRAAPSHDALSTATAHTEISELPPVGSYPNDPTSLSQYGRGLDHTYEMIETIRQADAPLASAVS